MPAARSTKEPGERAVRANTSSQPSPRPISILVADGHPVTLYTVAAALGGQADMNVVSTCRCGIAAAEAIRALAPDVAILDVAMPDFHAFDIVSTVEATGSRTKIIFFTGSITEGDTLNAIAAGVCGIVVKTAPLSQLISCVREVSAGRPCFNQDSFTATPKRNKSKRRSQGYSSIE